MLDVFLGIILPILIAFFLLSPIILSQGVPFYGDETYYYCNAGSSYFNSSNWFFMWTPQGPSSSLLTLFSYSMPLMLLVNLLGQELAVKTFILVVSSLSGILTYFALKILAKEWSLFPSEGKVRLYALVGALFMMLAFSNPGIIGVATGPSWSYAILPLSLALFVRYLKNGSLKDLFLLGVCSVFAIANPFSIYLMAVADLIYLILEIIAHGNIQNLFKRSIFVALAIIGLNAFWLIQTAASFVEGTRGIFQYYTTARLISLEGLSFLSHWNLLNVVMVGEQSYNFFWLHPQNYGPLNVIIPLLSAISLFAFRKKRQVLFVALILVIGIFLTKGVHEPGGYLYYLLASSLPYSAGAILRNPTKFVPLVNFPYAFLVGLSIALIYEKLRLPKTSVKPVINSRLLKYGVTISLISLVLVPIAYGSFLDLHSYTWPRYKPVYIPNAYDNINNWLLQEEGDFKVMWIPSGGSYLWKPYIITGFPDLLSAKPSVRFTKVYPQPWKSTDAIGRLLSVLGVKYVIYHGDSIDYPNDEILQDVMNQKDLRIVYSSNFTYIPEDDSQKPLPTEQTDIRFSNSSFKLNETKQLPRGEETNLVLYYKIPQDVVEMGFKGKFRDGFNILINGLPAGSSDLKKTVFWATVYEQNMINETEGYATFKVKVPNYYMGTAIDIYANLYDGGFKPLTPIYFTTRLLISPKEITVPIIVFQNNDYNEPIYASNSALTYGFGISALLNCDLLNTSLWSITCIENTSSDLSQLNNAKLFIYSNSSFPNWLDEDLANSNLQLVYMLLMNSLNLTEEQTSTGPFNPDYYVYNENPLVPIENVTLERGRAVQVTFNYELPNPVLAEGFKGAFRAGFGIDVFGYPHGVAPSPQLISRYRVFETAINNFTLIDDYSGYVTFNITIPATFQGSSVDVYANFYDGHYRPISPVYFQGTFSIGGISLIKSNSQPTELHIIDDSLSFNIYIPRNQEYTLAVKSNGTLYINGTTINGKKEWTYSRPFQFERGNITIELSTDGEAYIQDLVLLSDDQENRSIPEIFNTKAGNITDYEQISPVEWRVTLNSQEPFVLAFTEPYDPLWTADVNGKRIQPTSLYSMINGFKINQTGKLEITIEYQLQKWFFYGSIVSVTPFLACVTYLTYSYTRNKAILKRIKTTLKRNKPKTEPETQQVTKAQNQKTEH